MPNPSDGRPRINEYVPVGSDAHVRLLQERGTNRVIDEVLVTGDVLDTLGAMLTEMRRQTRLLSILVDEDLSEEETDSES